MSNNCGFRHLLVRNERAFYFGRPHPVTGNIDDVIDAAGDPIIAICITPTAIACEIFPRVGRKIDLFETFMIAVDRTHLARPRIRDDEITLARSVQHRAAGIHNLGLNPKERHGRRPRL
jgi:hypothetical protein